MQTTSYKEAIRQALAKKQVGDLRGSWRSVRAEMADEPDDDDDDANDDGEGEDDDDDDPEGSDEPKDEDEKNPRIKELSEEAKRHRIKAKRSRQRAETAETRNAQLEAELKQLKESGTTDEETKKQLIQLQDELAKRDRKLAEYAEERRSGRLRSEFDRLATAGKTRIDPEDLDDAFAVFERRHVLDNEDVEWDDEEESWEGVRPAFKAFIQGRGKKWVQAKKDDDDTDDDLPPSGRSVNGRRRNKDTYDTAALAKKFPALQRR